jgi:hypothetical protein
LLHFHAEGFNVNSGGCSHVSLDIIDSIGRTLRLLIKANQY